ncbi:MAG: hypothetical protein AAF065_05515 [Verrucomicrobiota bacterium]
MFTYVVPAFAYISITLLLISAIYGDDRVLEVIKFVTFNKLSIAENSSPLEQIIAGVAVTVYAAFAFWLIGNILAAIGSMIIEEIFIGRSIGYPFERIMGFWPRHSRRGATIWRAIVSFFHIALLLCCVWNNKRLLLIFLTILIIYLFGVLWFSLFKPKRAFERLLQNFAYGIYMKQGLDSHVFRSNQSRFLPFKYVFMYYFFRPFEIVIQIFCRVTRLDRTLDDDITELFCSKFKQQLDGINVREPFGRFYGRVESRNNDKSKLFKSSEGRSVRTKDISHLLTWFKPSKNRITFRFSRNKLRETPPLNETASIYFDRTFGPRDKFDGRKITSIKHITSECYHFASFWILEKTDASSAWLTRYLNIYRSIRNTCVAILMAMVTVIILNHRVYFDLDQSKATFALLICYLFYILLYSRTLYIFYKYVTKGAIRLFALHAPSSKIEELSNHG